VKKLTLRTSASTGAQCSAYSLVCIGLAFEAARLANRETSRLDAAICTEDAAQPRAFLDEYSGTAGYWNAPTRLTDGYELLEIPETGINVDRVPGPRGPVTFPDLYLRQYVVMPA
jgi:glutamate-5-semialdehyde dehydrogenase